MLNLVWIATMFLIAFAQPLPSGPGVAPETQTAAAAPSSVTVTGFIRKTVSVDDQSYAYVVYVPPDYTPERPWPVILPPRAGDAATMDSTNRYWHRPRVRRHLRNIPDIVVMPQCRQNESWVGPMAGMALRCVELTSREYNLDPKRVYLTGLSLGGQGAWMLAASYPDRWAAVVPICGFAEFGESTGLAEKIAPRLRDIPIWCFHGAADKSVPVEKSRELVEAIKAAGGKGIWYTEYPNGNHNVWDKAYDDPDLWRWLFAQERVDRKSE